MNKGVILANGEWINFMNAGDIFSSNDLIGKIFYKTNYNYDILIGKTSVNYDGFYRERIIGNLRLLWKGMQFCHQSVFVKSVILKNNLFSVDSPIAADFEFFLNVLSNSIVKVKLFDITIAVVSTGGISDKMRIETLKSWRNSVLRLRPNTFVKPYYFILINFTRAKMILKRTLPSSFINSLLRNF